MKKKEQLEKKGNREQTFLERYKSDEKYKAKVQLVGYGVLVAGLILYVNVASIGSGGSFENTIIDSDTSFRENLGNNISEDTDLLKRIKDNYEYDIKVSFQKSIDEESVDNTIRYTGKRYLNNTVIEKEDNEGNGIYYKVDSLYFIKDMEEFTTVNEEKVYNIIDSDFLEYSSFAKYLDKSSLDHVTDYSSGKKEYVYHLKIKDIMHDVKNLDDVIEIKIVEENEELIIDVDYSKLMKETNNDISACSVHYLFKNIGKVDSFVVFEKKGDVDNTSEDSTN